ncbi:MAG: lysostaphin resistance A-like protein [Candidatus Limivicinus sp.]
MNRKTLPFTSHLTKGQAIAALVYLPVHMVLLPVIATVLMLKGILDESQANLLCYTLGVAYMLIFLWKFFRRDFDALWDRPWACIREVLVCYGLMLCCNLVVNSIMLLLGMGDNPNNEALFGMAGMKFGPIAAMAVFMAPIVEESLFRAGLFGLIRRRNRTLAYVVSMAMFSLYHVWAYAFLDLKNLIYLLQYIPISYLLCRCYERTNSIWGSIFLHMLVNGVSMWLLYAMM